MPSLNTNRVQIHYVLEGAGDTPLVLVHGAWVSHTTFDEVVPRLPESFRVLRYDRRGHSKSERPPGQGSIREDVADLACLIERLDLGPAWVAGNSSGGAVALRLAAERPDLCRGIAAHEPAVYGLVADHPSAGPFFGEMKRRAAGVLERIDAGDHAGAAEMFFEMMLGPGSWAKVPEAFRAEATGNAPTFADEFRDPEAVQFELDWIRGFSKPVLLTRGDQSLPVFEPIVSKLTEALPRAETVTLAGAGHVPHRTHPDEYVTTLVDFIHRNDSPEPAH